MHASTRFGIVLLAVFSLSGAGYAQAPTAPSTSEQPAPQPAQAEKTTLDLRTNPLLDLHFLLRSVAAGHSQPPRLDGIEQSLDTVREIDKELASPLAWGLFDSTIAESADSAAMRKAFEALPESRDLLSGQKFALRARAVALADALIAVEPQFVAEVWPQRKKAIDESLAGLTASVIARQRECYAYIFESFGMTDPGLTIPVYIITTAPPFGGVTHRRAANQPGGVCIVGIDDNKGTLLYETTLHESLHALDVATAGQEHALNKIRKGLADAGLTQRSRALRDVPHTLMFVQAAATIRTCIDPNHVPYGDAAGYYAKVPQATEAVRNPWQEWLERKLAMDEAIAKIVEAGAGIADAPPR